VLDRLAPIGRWLFGRTALMLWLALMALALTVLLPLWPQLLAQAGDRLATPWMLFLVWLLYMPIKVLHELAHGLAARRFGGDVPEAGVTLLVLVPSPYVDVSDSAALARRSERLTIAGAGIASDLSVAAIGLLVWAAAGPGAWRDVAMAAMIVAGVGTVLFNLNPLSNGNTNLTILETLKWGLQLISFSNSPILQTLLL
jgi:putative peptide zinc metalloprotease protein